MKYSLLRNEMSYQHCVESGPFRVFYNLNGDGKSPFDTTCSKEKNIPDRLISILEYFQDAYNKFINDCSLISPIESGVYYMKGAKYIDIMIADIPIQKGLVSAQLLDNSSLFYDEDKHNGKSIYIKLDRNLIKNTATPIHELFHVFQYSYCNFSNKWFMEGLARWAQNLTHNRPMIAEKLPQNREELSTLLSRAHDAEYFWRQLLSFYSNRTQLIVDFLGECKEETHNIELNKKSTEQYITNNWTAEEKKNPKNNRYLLKALFKVLDNYDSNDNNELETFKSLIFEYATSETYETNSLHINTLHDLQKHTKTIKIHEKLIISGIDLTHINHFNDLTHVKTLIIKDCKNLQEINGFNSLIEIENIEIHNNINLTEIFGFTKIFKSNGTIPGHIKITSNKKLERVLFLFGLKTVQSSFYLHHNNLKSLHGLEMLEYVGASFSLSSNDLSDLLPLSKLQTVQGMLGVAFNNLVTLEGLNRLSTLGITKWSGQYRSLALQGNPLLTDLSSLKELKSRTNYLLLNTDMEQNFTTVPSQGSPFYNQEIDSIHGLDIITQYFPLYNPPTKIKVLFHNTWVNGISKNTWLAPSFIDFSNVEAVITFAKGRGIQYIYAQVQPAQKFLIKNEAKLKSSGLKFISNSTKFLDLYIDKEKFYNSMLERNLSNYIPKYYKKTENIEYPAIIKSPVGGNGKNMEILFSDNDLENSEVNGIVSEYIVDPIEYATNIMFKDGELLFHKTYKRVMNTDKFILTQDSVSKLLNLKPGEANFSNIFKNIINEDNYVYCCFDYKIVNGEPKIFEVNTRFGYTLIKHSDDFKKAINCYISECNKVSSGATN